MDIWNAQTASISPRCLVFEHLLEERGRRHAPSMIYTSGDTYLLGARPRVALSGTRNPSPAGLERAAALARLLARRRAVVVTGLARGIDEAATRAALEARGRAVAVLGVPLTAPAARGQEDLRRELKERHLVVSQFPPGRTPGRSGFPKRNRTIAWLADVVVLVEAAAGPKGGTQCQGWEALRLERPLWICESLATDARLEWPARMLEHGVRVLSRASLEECLASLPRAE
jgi:DNA processing protein